MEQQQFDWKTTVDIHKGSGWSLAFIAVATLGIVQIYPPAVFFVGLWQFIAVLPLFLILTKRKRLLMLVGMRYAVGTVFVCNALFGLTLLVMHYFV